MTGRVTVMEGRCSRLARWFPPKPTSLSQRHTLCQSRRAQARGSAKGLWDSLPLARWRPISAPRPAEFTDCLLQHGASKVYAIDVGYGQLAWSLRQDPRVVAMDRTN